MSSSDRFAIEIVSACNQVLSEDADLDPDTHKGDLASLLMWNVIIAAVLNLSCGVASAAVWQGITDRLKGLESKIAETRRRTKNTTPAASTREINEAARRTIAEVGAELSQNAVTPRLEDLHKAEHAVMRVLEAEQWPEARRAATAQKLVNAISAQLADAPESA